MTDTLLPITEEGEGVVFWVTASPRASRNAIAGIYQGTLKVKVAAPPVDGEANRELCSFLAKKLQLPKSALSVVAGETSKRKRVMASGATESCVRSLVEKR